MNAEFTPIPDRIADLLADRALQGLTDEQRDDLDRARVEFGLDVEEEWGFDLAAAALDEALRAGAVDAPPPHVMRRVQDQSVRWMAESRGMRVVTPVAAPMPSPAPAVRALNRGPWLVAAAAVLIAVVGWIRFAASTPDPAVARAALLQDAADARTVAWADNELGVSGDVVWSDERQEGYLRLRGLAANDPAVEQYQLWIFDRDRDERYPVDGGVFDIPEKGEESVVPIDPKIAVNEAMLFAVTIEPPGGVVVSDRTRLILAAPVE